MLFIYKNGSNPYITLTAKKTHEMLMKYDCYQIDSTTFYITAKKEPYKHDYKTIKNNITDIAIEWSLNFGEFKYYYSDLAEWHEYFETYGKRYGLLKEFKENGIV